MVRTSYGMLINEVFKVSINDVIFTVRVVEETLGPSTKMVQKYSPLLLDSEDLLGSKCSSWEEFAGKEDGSEDEDDDGSRGRKSVGSN